MKKLLVLALLTIGLTAQAGRINVNELGDSLTAIVQSKAHVGRVVVKNYRQHGDNIWVYTNSTIHDVAWSAQEIRQLRGQISLWVRGDKQGKVTIYSDKQEIGELVTARYKVRNAADCHRMAAVQPLVSNASRAYSAPKGLDTKHIALWGSHGLYYVQDYQQWKWQRARLWTTVEDLYTSSYTRPFVVPMLENAGAVVIQPRERDIQLHEVIVDETEASGNWTLSDQPGWATPTAPLLEGVNPFTMGHYAVSPKPGKEAQPMRYTPHIEQAGEYAVYISYATLPQSTSKAEYTVMHDGVATNFVVNQTMGGSTWVYVGTFYFGTQPEKNYVLVSNKADKKQLVTSDAIKFGGGMGSVARYPQPGFVPGVAKSSTQIEITEPVVDSVQLLANQQIASVSGFPRYIEGARYWMQYSGIPDSVYNYTQSRNDYIDDYAARGRWVNYLAGGSQAYPEGPGLGIPVNLSLAFHSDAGTYMDDKIVGTLTVYTPFDHDGNLTYPAGGSRMCNRDLADYIQEEIVAGIQQSLCPTWPKRRLWESNYAESRNPKVPSALLELLSHQNYADMIYGLNPEFKFVVGRGIYKAMLKFLHAMDNTPYVVQPLPVQQFGMERNGQQLRLHWAERVDSLEPTAKPTYYIVYTRAKGRDWDNGVLVQTTEYTLNLEDGILYDFRICAGNEGGISLPSEILSACLYPQTPTTLVINGFHRVCGPDMIAYDSVTGGVLPYAHAIPYGQEISYLGEQFDYDRLNPWHSDDDCGFGMNYSDQANKINVGNTFDYPHMHGLVLQQRGISFISCSSDAVSDLQPYALVDLIMGKQKGPRSVIREGKIMATRDEQGCIPMSLRASIQDYLAAGGRMLLSGSYIASNMQSDADTAFIHNVLHYKYKSARASNCGQINIMYSVLPNRPIHWETQPNQHIIECEAPDGIDIMTGAKRLARYDDCGLGAGIAYDQNERLLVFPFMMESVQEFDSFYNDCIDWLMK